MASCRASPALRFWTLHSASETFSTAVRWIEIELLEHYLQHPVKIRLMSVLSITSWLPARISPLMWASPADCSSAHGALRPRWPDHAPSSPPYHTQIHAAQHAWSVRAFAQIGWSELNWLPSSASSSSRGPGALGRHGRGAISVHYRHASTRRDTHCRGICCWRRSRNQAFAAKDGSILLHALNTLDTCCRPSVSSLRNENCSGPF